MHLRPAPVRAGGLLARTWFDYERSMVWTRNCDRIGRREGDQPETGRQGSPYPIRTKGIDGGAREWSTEENDDEAG